MSYKKSLFNPKNEKARKVMKIVGPICMVIGFGLIIFSFMTFFNNPQGIIIPFILGGVSLMIGTYCINLGFRKNIRSYTASQDAPIIKDTVDYIANESALSNLVGSSNICPKCGEHNEEDAKFCDKCGTKLVNVCPNCGTENKADAKFCSNCGKEL